MTVTRDVSGIDVPLYERMPAGRPATDHRDQMTVARDVSGIDVPLYERMLAGRPATEAMRREAQARALRPSDADVMPPGRLATEAMRQAADRMAMDARDHPPAVALGGYSYITGGGAARLSQAVALGGYPYITGGGAARLSQAAALGGYPYITGAASANPPLTPARRLPATGRTHPAPDRRSQRPAAAAAPDHGRTAGAPGGGYGQHQ